MQLLLSIMCTICVSTERFIKSKSKHIKFVLFFMHILSVNVCIITCVQNLLVMCTVQCSAGCCSNAGSVIEDL